MFHAIRKCLVHAQDWRHATMLLLVEITSSTFPADKKKQTTRKSTQQTTKLWNLGLELTSIAQTKMALWSIILWWIIKSNLSKEAMWTMAHVVLWKIEIK